MAWAGSAYPWQTASPRSRTSPSTPAGTGLPAASTMRISIPAGGRPSVVARFSAVSSGAPMVIMGTSVMP